MRIANAKNSEVFQKQDIEENSQRYYHIIMLNERAYMLVGCVVICAQCDEASVHSTNKKRETKLINQW